METVLEDIKIDPDIVDILEEVSRNSAMADAYPLETIEAIEPLSDIKNRTILPAEWFYRILLTIIPEDGIIQHRIGTDYTSGNPTVLTVVSGKYEDKIPEIDLLARNIELYLFNERDCDCDFWVITDRNIEQTLVERDFPCFRRRGI